MVRGLENKFNHQEEVFHIEDEQKPKNQIEEIAVRAVKLAGLSVRLGDYEFVSTSVRLLEPFIKAWYAKQELNHHRRRQYLVGFMIRRQSGQSLY